MMAPHAAEAEARGAPRSSALLAEAASKGESSPPCVYVAVTEAAPRAKDAREERATLLPGFDAVEAAQHDAPSENERSARCCASRRPPAGWRVALGAAAAWILVMLGGWTAVVMSSRSRSSSAPHAMQGSAAAGSVLARSAAAADICDPLELQACAGSQPWWNGGTVYQVYPRSYQDSDGDGVGDLAGVLQRIDYIASLNVSAIWLSPIFPSPMVRRFAWWRPPPGARLLVCV